MGTESGNSGGYKMREWTNEGLKTPLGEDKRPRGRDDVPPQGHTSRQSAPSQPLEASDREIVDKVRKGDREAFEMLYGRYFKRIYGFIDRRMGVRADVEETTQEVFIAVFSCLDSYRGEAPFSAWIFGVTRRVIASRFKRKRHPTVPLFEEDSESSTAHASTRPTPLEEYECQERIEEMTTAANKLTDEQKMLFRMHHIDERPISEIALKLKKSEDAIKSNLYRARKLLLPR
ncbi:MAG TPA: sigma-70 family RNA polymerase sigma factor [Myxococcales bacterium]|nr:sigma-70 family RNA polymerase sigma factor [Myxococcales bacterium]